MVYFGGDPRKKTTQLAGRNMKQRREGLQDILSYRAGHHQGYLKLNPIGHFLEDIAQQGSESLLAGDEARPLLHTSHWYRCFGSVFQGVYSGITSFPAYSSGRVSR